jgi:hypothetical protein
MKLKSILKQQPLDRLEKILKYWKLQEPAKKWSDEDGRRLKLVDHLYPRLQMTQYFNPAYAKLTNDERELIAFLVIHGGDLSREEVLRRQFNGDEETYKELMERLGCKGFAFEDDLSDEEVGAVLVGVPEPYIRYIDLPSYWEGYLGYFLRDMTTPQLKSLGNTRLGIELKSSKKNYLISQIRSRLLDPKRLREYLGNLTESERQVFDLIVAKRGVCVYRDLLESGHQKRYDHSRADHINHLVDGSGLIFMAGQGENKYSNLVMVPRDIHYMATHEFRRDDRSLSQLDTVSIISREKHPSFVADNSNNILRDLVVFAGYINANMVRTLANGGIGKKDLKKIQPLLSSNKTPKYASFLALFLITEKFIISVGETWKVSNTFPRWLEDSANCYRHLFAFWLDTNEWNEEYLEGDTVHAETFPANLVNITELRKIVLRNLEAVPPGRWLKFRAWADTVMPQIEQAMSKRAAAASLDKFNRTMPNILESIVGECLYWLGLATIGMDDAGGLGYLGQRGSDSSKGGRRRGKGERAADEFAFRMTPLGEAALRSAWAETGKLFEGQHTEHLLTLRYNVENFTVMPSMEVIAPPDLSLRALYHLNEFCDVRTVDVMTTFAITRESLRKGMDKGLRAEDIQRFLVDNSRQAELPDTVRHLIRECSSKHGEVRLGFAGGYLLVEDERLVEELRNSRRLKTSIKDVIDNRVVLLNNDVDVKKLGKILQKMGYMPHLDSEHVHVTQDNKFHLTFSSEELYGLMAALRYLIEIEEEMATPIASDDARSLLERLRPDASAFYELNFFADNLCKRYSKKYEATLKKRIDDATSKYKKQVSKLISNTPRQTSKYAYSGENPSREEEDILEMLDFAMENEMEVEIIYMKTNQEEVSERIEPESVAGGKLYAFNPKRDSYSVYRLNRIKQSMLV